MVDDVVRAVIKGVVDNWPRDVRVPEDLQHEIANRISAYRAHTLAEAGECESLIAANLWNNLCEKDDRSSPEDYPDHCLITREELSSYISEAFEAGRSTNTDLIAAQRERIAELEKALVPFAKNSDLAGNASDELIVGLLANGITDAITVRDLRRVRAALGSEGLCSHRIFI